MQKYEFRANLARTLGPFALMLGGSIAAIMFSIFYWNQSLISGVALALSVFFGLGAAILGYRLFARPVMLRVDADGLFIKRLGVTIPWAAIENIERTEVLGNTIYAVKECDGGHPVFDTQSLVLGAALNARIGLPGLSVAISQYAGSPSEFEAAIAASAPTGSDILTQSED